LKKALGAFLLEVLGSGRRRLETADAATKLGDVGPRPRVRKDPDGEGKGYRTDVVTALYREPERDGGQVQVGELPVGGSLARVRAAGSRGTSAPAVSAVAEDWQQAEGLPVSEHSRGCVQPVGRLGDAHES
jgi:hypothetical protein